MIQLNRSFRLLLALGLSLWGRPVDAQNLVTNGSFTAGNTGWAFYAPAITAETFPETMYGGTNAANTTAEIDAQSDFRQTNIAVTPGETYHLSFKYSRRTAGGTGFALPPIPCIIKTRVYNGANLFLDQDISASNTVFDWQCGNYQFTPTTNTITLDFENVNNPGTLGMILDDVTITPVNQPIAFASQACIGGDFTLTAPASNPPETQYTNYTWTGPNGYTATGVAASITNAQTFHEGIYTCTMNLNGCLTVVGQFAVTLSAVSSTDVLYICSGDSIDIFGQFRNVDGVYSDTFQNVNGCDSVATVTLHVVPTPGKIIALDSIIACQYDTVRLETSTMPLNPALTYSWIPAVGLNSTTEPNVWFVADHSVNYTLRVSAPDPNLSCWMEHTVHVIVNPGDFLKLNLNDTGICPGQSVQLRASGAQQYQWSPGLYIDDVYSPQPLIHAETSMDYALIGISDKGCRDTQFVHLTVHPAAVLNMPHSVSIYPGESYAIEPATNATYLSWFPHSGLSAYDVANPLMAPEVDTRYFVTATTEYGCAVSDSVDVWVQETVVDMPNAFVPDNGSYKAVKRGLASLHSFKVFNRWGEELFSTADVEQGWNGTYNGIPQPAGVYVYAIEGTTISGKPFRKQGTLTLLR